MPRRSPYPPEPISYARFTGFGQQSGSGDTIRDLILQGGQIAAQGAQNNAQIWGNTLSNVGQTLSTALTTHAEETARTKRDLAFREAVSSGDPNRILSVLGPKDGPPVIAALKTAVPDALKTYKDRMEVFRDGARGILASPEGSRSEGYTFLRDSYIRNGVAKPEELPNTYEEAVSQGILDAAANYGQEPARPRAPIAVAPGATLVDPETNQPVFSAPARPAQAANVGSFEDYVVRRFGENPTPEQITEARRVYQQSDDRPRISINTPRPLSQTAEAQIIQRLTKQWDTTAAPVREINRQVGIMDAGLEAARRGDTNAGSQAVIQTFNKILDSLSVVREGEYARTAEGQSAINRVKGAIERLQQGGAGVPFKELEKFATLARDMAERQKAFLPAMRDRIGRQADRYNIPQELIFEDTGTPEPPPAGARPIPPGATPGPVRVSSPEQARSLPPGTEFQTPDGRIMRVPLAR